MMSWIVRYTSLVLVTLGAVSCASSVQSAAPAAEPVRSSPEVSRDAPRPRPVPIVPVSTVAFPAERAEVPEPNPHLPEIPYVNGKLKVNVIYPPKNALIASKDSNFIIGSIGNGYSGLRINGELVPVWPNGAFMGWIPNPSVKQQAYEIVAYTAKDTVIYVHPVRTRAAHPPKPGPATPLRTVSPSQLSVLTGGSIDAAVPDTDKVVIGRPTRTGTYKWFLFPGTVVRVNARQGNMTRVMLDAGREIWVNEKDVGPLKTDQKVVREKIDIKGASLIPQNDWIDFKIPINQPPAYAVEQPDESTLTLVFYNATTDPDEPIWLSMSADPYLTRSTVSRSANRVVYKFFFSRPVYGYLPMYENGEMTFRMRRPPFVSRDNPLEGLTIAIDAGHPPAGTTGPTGLYEAIPNFAVAQKVQQLLSARGANVVMTRKDDKPMGLIDRTVKARRNDAHALVSIHLNAVPDGTNPFRANGTSTYYFHLQSRRLATFVQRGMVALMGLKDLGVFHSNLAMARPTWMPAVLAEGAFLIMPDQEAAMRTPEYQNAYARGVVNGLEEFFRTYSR